MLAIAAFATAVALGLLAIGPFVMTHLFGQHYSYGRFGLALIGIGMGLHLVSGALNQAALARDRARAAAACWGIAAAVFVAWMFVPAVVNEQLLRTEIGYAGATALLALMLGVLYRSSGQELAGAQWQRAVRRRPPHARSPGRPARTAQAGTSQAASTARAIAR